MFHGRVADQRTSHLSQILAVFSARVLGSFFWGPVHWYRAVGGHVHRDMTSTIWCIRTCATTESRMIKSRQNHNHHNQRFKQVVHALVLGSPYGWRTSAAPLSGAGSAASDVKSGGGAERGRQVHAAYEAPRRQKAPLPGTPAPQFEVAAPQGARCLVDGGPSLAVPVLAGRGAETPLLHGCCAGGQKEGGGGGGECGE